MRARHVQFCLTVDTAHNIMICIASTMRQFGTSTEKAFDQQQQQKHQTKMKQKPLPTDT